MADDRLLNLVSSQLNAGKTEEEIRKTIGTHGYTVEDINGALATATIARSRMGAQPAIQLAETHRRSGAGTAIFQFSLIAVLLISAPGAYSLVTTTILPALTGKPASGDILSGYGLLKDVPGNASNLLPRGSGFGIAPLIPVSGSAHRDPIDTRAPVQPVRAPIVSAPAPAPAPASVPAATPVQGVVPDQAPYIAPPVQAPPVVVPPPVVTPPVITPPPSPAYPAAIAAAGLQNVWDIRTAAGLQSRPTRSPAADPLPDGTATSTENGQAMLRITKDASFNGWDFTGWRVIIIDPVTVTFTNSMFSNPGGYSILDVGIDDNHPGAQLTPNVTCSHCEFDLGGIIEFFESPIRDSGAATFTLQDSYLHDTSRDDMSIGSSGTFTATRNYFTAPGLNSQPDDHIEVIHIYSGTSLLSQNLFDMTNAAGKIRGGLTGVVYPEGFSGPLKLTIDRNIFVGSNAMGLYYVMQMYDRYYPEEVRITNTVMEKGSSPNAYMGRTGNGILIMKGNYDFATGDPIPDSSIGLTAAAINADIHLLVQFFRRVLGLI